MKYIIRLSLVSAFLLSTLLFFLSPEKIALKPIMEEIYKFMVSVIAIVLPVYLAILTLYYTFVHSKILEISEEVEGLRKTIDPFLAEIPIASKVSGYTMVATLFFISSGYLFAMLISPTEVPSISKYLCIILIFIFIVSIIEALTASLQIIHMISVVCDKKTDELLKKIKEARAK